MARAAKVLSTGERFDHPVLASPGWWHRPNRFYGARHVDHEPDAAGAPLLVIGATGTLGQALRRVAHHRGLAVRATSRADLDLEDPASIRGAIERHEPWAIVNAAGFVRVANAEQDREGCFAANAGGVEHLAQAAAAFGVPLVGISTDLVFDGQSGPYGESAPCNPQGVYGQSKYAAEQTLLSASPANLLVRTAAFFGPWDPHNFAWHTLRALKRGERVEASADVRVSPTYVPDLAHALLDLLIDGASGRWHLVNEGALSWYEFARQLAHHAGVDAAKLVPTHAAPSDTSLVSERGTILRPVDAAIRDYARDFARIEAELSTRGEAAREGDRA
jgi:dTDP-4-dehydrorhamnose reductase